MYWCTHPHEQSILYTEHLQRCAVIRAVLITWFGHEKQGKGKHCGAKRKSWRLVVSSAGDACAYPYKLLRGSFLGGLRKLHSRIFFFGILQSNVFCQTRAFLLIFLYIKVCFPLEIWDVDNCTTAAGIWVHRVSSVSLCCFIWMGNCEK